MHFRRTRLLKLNDVKIRQLKHSLLLSVGDASGARARLMLMASEVATGMTIDWDPGIGVTDVILRSQSIKY